MQELSYQTWFAVRYVHLASVALLIGGAFTTFALCATTGALAESRAALAIAVLYERLFWLVAGVTVATGISNLGLKGQGLLGPETTWGAALTLKLATVLFLLALSLVRSDFVIRCLARADADTGRERLVLTLLYALTVVVLLHALWSGLGLAHGRY